MRPYALTDALHEPAAGHLAGGSHRALALGLPVASDPPGWRQVLALGPWRPPSRARAWRLGFQVLDNGSADFAVRHLNLRRALRRGDCTPRHVPSRVGGPARPGPAAPARVHGLRVVWPMGPLTFSGVSRAATSRVRRDVTLLTRPSGPDCRATSSGSRPIPTPPTGGLR